MKTVKIASVPEHFNLPWHLALEEGAFEQRGIDLQWTDVPEGTGRMCDMLASGDTDLAVILTEGIVKSITEGNPSSIIQEFIGTPLLWGIHVSANSEYYKLSDLRGTKAAISRFGSGSHLMSYVLADSEGWDHNQLEFEVVNHLEGAVKALDSENADYFLWERFTTQPLVDKGVFRRLGDCPTPWPCFVIAARKEFLKGQSGLMRHLLEIINNYTLEFRYIPSIDRTLANRYHQKLEDIREWLGLTQWSQSQISAESIEKVIHTLHHLKLIDKKIRAEDLLTNL